MGDPDSERRGREVAGLKGRTGAGPGTSAAALDSNAVANTQDTVEIAKDLVVDLRAELPRIDARAAAGVALVAAILVSVVTQIRLPMPIYPLAVAAFLTVALLLFLMVLLPTPTLPAHQSLVDVQSGGRSGARGDITTGAAIEAGWTRRVLGSARGTSNVDLGSGCARPTARYRPCRMNRAHYHATVAIQIAAQVRTKQRLLMLAFTSGSLGVAALALGATWALFLGYR